MYPACLGLKPKTQAERGGHAPTVVGDHHEVHAHVQLEITEPIAGRAADDSAFSSVAARCFQALPTVDHARD